MLGQPPMIWHKADNFIVSDKWGNRWLDWSSCVLVSNAGHGREEIKKAIIDEIEQGLLKICKRYIFVDIETFYLVKNAVCPC